MPLSYREDDRRIMTMRESAQFDRDITGNYGEDSVQAENFDRAFTQEDDPTLALLRRVLGSFDLDLYAEGSVFSGFTYHGRLWEEGETVVEVSGKLSEVLERLDRNAAALVAAYNM